MKESHMEHIGMGEPREKLEARDKEIAEELARLDDEARLARMFGKMERADALCKEREVLLKEQRALAQKIKELKGHPL